jgi:hypothetical protein
VQEFIGMIPEDHTTAIHALQNAIFEIRTTLNCPTGTAEASAA